ncbi:RUN domain-containing protein 1-like [Schistocerca nitens]|uniref:RUN domain-containing protein 1-like n=1 Tax=Schistocerca nitens TaxID=7011 RepID=UPI002118A8AF|nr:RUN domain-containing protein 1-like [Schistocerca nitens]
MEVAVWKILETLSASDGDEDWSCIRRLVRKDLADNLRDLLEHGFKAKRRSFCRFFLRQLGSCDVVDEGHAWDLLLAYYRASRGHHFSASPRRSLSRSYGLCIRSEAPSGKERLLAVVEELEATRKTCGRDADSVFRAFVCAALNTRRLAAWLRRVVRCRALVQTLYEPWAYVARTRAKDALDSLARLQARTFRLPLDPALRSLHAQWLSLPPAPCPPSPEAADVDSAK